MEDIFLIAASEEVKHVSHLLCICIPVDERGTFYKRRFEKGSSPAGDKPVGL